MYDEPKIQAVRGETEGDILFAPPLDRIRYRTVREWSPSCGTYGMGGPGFLGFRLAETPTYPEEWLMLRLWGACSWLSVNGHWLEALPAQYETCRPLHSNYAGYARWDEFGPLVAGRTIQCFALEERSFDLLVGDARIRLTEEPDTRPPYSAGPPRTLAEGDDLREAWVIAPYPWVRV